MSLRSHIVSFTTLLIATALAGAPAMATPPDAGLDPLGGRSGLVAGWKPEWSTAFFECWDKLPNAVVTKDGDQSGNGGTTRVGPMLEQKIQIGLDDVGPGKPWCDSQGALDNPYQIKLFYLSILKSLAAKECSFNPNASNPKSPNPPAMGLFQMGPTDVKAWGCEKPDGSGPPSTADLRDPKTNICCALKIADGLAKKGAGGDVKDTRVLASGKDGILGAFWQPVREGIGLGGGSDGNGKINGTENSNDIKKFVNGACRTLAGSGSGPEFTEEEITRAKGSSGPGRGFFWRSRSGDR